MSAAGVVTQVIPYIFYKDVPVALAWLAKAFDFVEVLRVGTPNGGIHGEMLFDGQRIMMGQGNSAWHMASPSATNHIATQGIFVYLGDVDAHYARALEAGAEIVDPPRDLSYGRSYTARDLEGHPWFFTQPPADNPVIS
ncbi:MAG TPA: VOC family protein [Lichenihabitans sp.]|jgi:uncharacterized glyoxalase superfamily protein PhnB|nr:VOC family protein [Lichenihabitans sp.]